MLTMASVEAPNGFGNLLDKAQRQMVSVTRQGRAVALVMSPEVLEDYVDARLSHASRRIRNNRRNHGFFSLTSHCLNTN